MSSKQEKTVTQLQEELSLLEQEYEEKKKYLQRELKKRRKKAQKKGLLIPARSFSTTLTPLETIVSALHSWYGLLVKEIAELLQRPTSSIDAALANSQKKGVGLYRFEDEQIQVDVAAIDPSLSPAKAVIAHLLQQELSPASIARLIGRDQRNIAKVRDELGGDLS